MRKRYCSLVTTCLFACVLSVYSSSFFVEEFFILNSKKLRTRGLEA